MLLKLLLVFYLIFYAYAFDIVAPISPPRQAKSQVLMDSSHRNKDAAEGPSASARAEHDDDSKHTEQQANESESRTTEKASAQVLGVETAEVSPTMHEESAHRQPPPQEGEHRLSKNQLKKRRRWEKAMAVKKRRKQQEKEAKIAKAKSQGRDLEEERRILEQRTLEGANKKKRQAQWEKEYMPLVKTSFQVCIDCAYEQQMVAKEINSLSLQIRYCYAENKKNPHPCRLSVASMSGKTLENLQNVNGFDEWTLRAFSFTDKPVNDLYHDRLQDVVYLTSDAKDIIEDLDNSKIYVIGGIVDRNRLQRAAINRAEQIGVATAKLPLDTYLKKMTTTKVLTTNHVFSILLKYREHGNNWEKALLEVLPSRKDVQPAAGHDSNGDIGKGNAAPGGDESS